MRNIVIAAASLVAFASPNVFGQQPNTAGTSNANPPGPPTAQAKAAAAAGMPEIARGSRILGQRIENSSGEGLGEIKELILDARSGRIQQVIVDVGGILGLGSKSVALQWDQLRTEYDMGKPGTSQPPALTGADQGAGTTPARRAGVRSADLRFVADMSKEQLEAAPEYRYEGADR